MILALEIAGVRIDLSAPQGERGALERLLPFAEAKGSARWHLELSPGPKQLTPPPGRSFVERGGRLVIPGAEGAGWLDPALGNGWASADPSLFFLDAQLRAVVAREILERGGLLLHGVAVQVDGRAYLCPARSGSGKSTLASLSGHPLSDEVSALAPLSSGGFAAHATPWWRSSGGSAPLAAVCALTWDGEGLDPQPGTPLRQLISNLVLPVDSAPNRARALEVAAEVALATPFARLAFRQTSDVDGLLRRGGGEKHP